MYPGCFRQISQTGKKTGFFGTLKYQDAKTASLGRSVGGLFKVNMYTPEQQKIIRHTKGKVKALFVAYPIKAHGFDHAQRVSKWAVIIAMAEKDNLFLAEMSAWLHDIGRATEHLPGNTKRHHELSYDMCREWFKEDSVFGFLSTAEKLTILYAVRYHWNEAAGKYKVAWILRDADKLDAFGVIGLKRSKSFFNNDENVIMHDIRLRYEMLHNFRTKKSRQIMKNKHLFEPLRRYQRRILKSKIKPVEL